jgi:hypothetical protein
MDCSTFDYLGSSTVLHTFKSHHIYLISPKYIPLIVTANTRFSNPRPLCLFINVHRLYYTIYSVYKMSYYNTNYKQSHSIYFRLLQLVCSPKQLRKTEYRLRRSENSFSFVCFHGRPRQATGVLQSAGLLYRPLWTFQLWPPDAPAPTDAFRTLAAEVGTYGRGIGPVILPKCRLPRYI